MSCGLVGDSLPDVTIDLYTSEAVGLDGLHHPSLRSHQGIGITHAVVLALVQVALAKGRTQKRLISVKTAKITNCR